MILVRSMLDDGIRYARHGDIHLAYEVVGPGGGADVVLIRAYVSQHEVFAGSR